MRHSTKYDTLFCSALVVMSILAQGHVALAQKIVKSEDGNAPQEDDAHKPTTAKKKPIHKPASSQLDGHEESVVVTAGMATANGVTNTTPGGGLMPVQTAPRSQSGVTRDFIAKQSPTSNAQALIQNLPGVIAANNDSLGLTDSALTIRGMVEQQIGYLFEGAPAADPISYMPYTNTLVDAENLASVTVIQGSSDITAPFYNAVGGQVSMFELNPTERSGGYIEAAGGNKSANKEFIRLESGEIGNTGIRSFASFSHTSANNWRGSGGTVREHVDAKVVKEWADGSNVHLVFAYNHTHYIAYTRPTLAQWQQYGEGYNYNSTYTPGDTQYYKLNTYNNNALILTAPISYRLSSGVWLHSTPYLNDISGPSTSGATLSENDSFFGTVPAGPLNQPYATKGTITALSVDPYDEKTAGLNNYIEWKRGINTIVAGYWYSYSDHSERQSYATVDYDGNVSNSSGRFAIQVPDGRPLAPYDINFKQQTNTLYLSDTLSLLEDKLSVTAGFKTSMIGRWSTNLVPGADYVTNRNYFEPLPQFYASYKITPHDQIYVDGTTAFRAPATVEAYVQIFSPSSSHAIEQPGSLKAEYSIGEEIGYRHTGFINTSLAAFNYNVTNHQVTSTGFIPGTTTLITEPLDVGGETVQGVQAEVGLGHWHHISPYISGQYLHATTDNNYNAGADYLPTTGKIAVQSPKFSGSIGLQYDDGRIFGNFDLRYVDSQYSTFMDDQSIPAYIVSDVTLGYRLPTLGLARHPQIQLNLTNIGGNSYLSGYSSVTGNAVTTRGVFGKSVAGSAPAYYVGGGFGCLVSLASAF